MPEARAATGSSNPTPQARGCGQEGQPHVQGVVAVQAQEGLEEPSHIDGQEGQWEEIPLIQGKEQLLGSSPGGSREFKARMVLARKDLFVY